MEAVLSLRPRHAAVGAVQQSVSAVEVQLMGGRSAVPLTETQLVTQKALITAHVNGPGLYTLWCGPVYAELIAVFKAGFGSAFGRPGSALPVVAATVVI